MKKNFFMTVTQEPKLVAVGTGNNRQLMEIRCSEKVNYEVLECRVVLVVVEEHRCEKGRNSYINKINTFRQNKSKDYTISFRTKIEYTSEYLEKKIKCCSNFHIYFELAVYFETMINGIWTPCPDISPVNTNPFVVISHSNQREKKREDIDKEVTKGLRSIPDKTTIERLKELIFNSNNGNFNLVNDLPKKKQKVFEKEWKFCLKKDDVIIEQNIELATESYQSLLADIKSVLGESDIDIFEEFEQERVNLNCDEDLKHLLLSDVASPTIVVVSKK